jgi:FtsH-binding integral membrane protein
VALGAGAVIGAGYMALTGLVIVWAVQDQPEHPGAAVATGFLLLAVAQMLVSPVAGVIADGAGLPAAFALAAGVAAVGGLVRPRRSLRVPAAA